MDERLKILALNTTTADSNEIKVNFEEQKLTLSYKDYNGVINKIIFNNVIAFNFVQIGDATYSDDCIYNVNNSHWLNDEIKKYLIVYPADDVSNYQHYKFCFNETGEELNIICHKDLVVIK